MRANFVDKILRNGRGMILAYDHGFEHGPVDFDEKSIDPAWVMEIANNGNFTAVACQKGIASYYYDSEKYKVPLILKLNGKTSFHKEEEPISLQNCSVDEAVSLGAIGVGYTIYVGSEHEETMICEFSKIEKEAHAKGLVVVGWMYPRGKHVPNDVDKDVLAYSARMALELNCDAVKIKYTGDVESFRWVVKSAGRVKVFVVGGPRTEMHLQLLDTARQVIEAGAVGFAIGRNIWQAKDPLEASTQIAQIVYSS
jgi:class I fructose-bisphosphate aldolase